MKMTKHYLRNRDVDWAVCVGDLYIHASSAGDDLPEIVEQNIIEIWRTIKSAEEIYSVDEVKMNDEYLNSKFPQRQMMENEDLRLRKEWYVHSFRAMAMRGFYSYDRDISTPFGKSTYHLVASPGENNNNVQIDLPHIDTNISIEELKKCNLVEVINQLSQHGKQNLK